MVNGYTLSLAVLLVVGGRMGDIFGRLRMFVFGVVLFTIASMTAGLAPSSFAAVASRVIQGIGAVFMMPGTLSIITDAFPPAQRGVLIRGQGASVDAELSATRPDADRMPEAATTVA
ncbi:MAG: MFS transporter [Solirubrobacterales bacterium]